MGKKGDKQEQPAGDSRGTFAWRRIFDSLDTPLWAMTPDRVILSANAAALRLLGRPASEVHGRRCYELVHGTDKPIDECPLDEALRRRRRGSASFTALGREMEGVVDPVTDDSGNLLGAAHLLFSRPAVEAAAARRDLERRKEELEDFLMMAAHDIRTPLLCIQGYSGFLESDIAKLIAILENGGLSEETRFAALELARSLISDSVKPVSESAEFISRLTDAIIQTARAGRTKLEPRTVDAEALLKKLRTVLAPRIAEAGARLELGPLPPCTADLASLEQIFLNLICNALKFRDHRPLEVRVSGRVEGGKVIYSVADNGRGIRPEDLEEIWRLFFTRHRDGEEGQGIGLTMTRRLAEANGGSIRAESESGKGSVFLLELPR